MPFRGKQAESLWIDYNVGRLKEAIALDAQPNRGIDAFHLATAAHVELSRFPAFALKANELIAPFFKGRAVRAANAEDRDEAILWWLKALAVQPDHKVYRQAASQLIDTDYARLERTVRIGNSSRLVQANLHNTYARSVLISADGRRLAGSDRDMVRVWNLDRPGERAIELRESDFVYDMAFSADGRRLASIGGFHGVVVRIWDLDRPGPGRLNCRRSIRSML